MAVPYLGYYIHHQGISLQFPHVKPETKIFFQSKSNFRLV